MRPVRILLVLAFCVGSLAVSAVGSRLAPVPIDQVEEDWELVLGEPDVDNYGPQITTTMSPIADTHGESMSFNLNYRDDPFRPGGLQLRTVAEGEPETQVNVGTTQAATNGETITWTQRMLLSSGRLYYQISGGSSTSWGPFGADQPMSLSIGTNLASLDGYRSAESIANSGPGWQSNRVSRMRLLRVRKYSNGQLVSTDELNAMVVGQ